MRHLFLEDLKGMTEDEVKVHLAENYSYASDRGGAEITKYLKDYDIVIAYESAGGCDGSSYFLIQHKMTGVYEEFSGEHCSCFGFEGQFDPEEVMIEYLKSSHFYFKCGEYDVNESENIKAVKEFISSL